MSTLKRGKQPIDKTKENVRFAEKFNISYQTLPSSDKTTRNDVSGSPEILSDIYNFGLNAALCDSVSDKIDKSGAVVPVSNIPSADLDSGLPTERDMVVYRLKRRVEALKQNEKQLLAKLTRLAEIITNEKRFIEVGLLYDQWETIGELKQRKARLVAALDLISDPNANPQVEERQKVKL